MSIDKDQKQIKERLGTVGGQAVMEGVMMRSKEKIALSVRRLDNGEIVVRDKPVKSIRDRVKLFNLPIIRGIVNFIESLVSSFSTLTESAEMIGMEEEEPTRFEKWLNDKFGASIMTLASVIGVILGLFLAVLLFMYLPDKTTGWLDIDIFWIRALVSGVIKIGIFILYLFLASLWSEMRKVFQYHGAEHKTIFCYESGEELTVENVKKQLRFHPRCGTSFMFVMLFLSIVTGAFIPVWDNVILRTVIKILVLPVVVGVGYEFIRYAGRHDNLFVRIVSAPGLWMQRITTKEPDETMIEVAIVSLKSALPKEFPDFVIPYEKKKEETEKSDDNSRLQTEPDTKE